MREHCAGWSPYAVDASLMLVREPCWVNVPPCVGATITLGNDVVRLVRNSSLSTWPGLAGIGLPLAYEIRPNGPVFSAHRIILRPRNSISMIMRPQMFCQLKPLIAGHCVSGLRLQVSNNCPRISRNRGPP